MVDTDPECKLARGILSRQLSTLISSCGGPETDKYPSNVYRTLTQLISNISAPGYADASKAPMNARIAYTCLASLTRYRNSVKVPQANSSAGSQ